MLKAAALEYLTSVPAVFWFHGDRDSEHEHLLSYSVLRTLASVAVHSCTQRKTFLSPNPRISFLAVFLDCVGVKMAKLFKVSEHPRTLLHFLVVLLEFTLLVITPGNSYLYFMLQCT